MQYSISATLNITAVLDSEFEALDATVRSKSLPPEVSDAWDKIKQIVKTAIKAILPQLWRLISKVLRLKEWTVKGSVGVPVFGLASAEISLTFGP